MTRTLKFNWVVFALAIIGALIAGLLTMEHYLPNLAKLTCGSGGGCQDALSSKYGSVGPIPVGAFGFAMYAALTFLAFRRYRLSKSGNTASGFLNNPDLLAKVMWGIAAIGMCISIWFQFIALYVIMSFCPYCFTSACTVTLIFVMMTIDQWFLGQKLDGEKKMLSGVIAFVLIGMCVMYAPGVIERWRMVTDVNSRPGPPKAVESPVSTVIPDNPHVTGDPKAPITLVKFADFMCPPCKKSIGPVHDLLAHRPDIKLIYRHYPMIKIHKFAQDSAAMSEAAAMQGKFDKMSDVLFLHQDEMHKPDFSQKDMMPWAEEAGMDITKFTTDIQSEKTKNIIAKDMADAETLGVVGTPCFFLVNGKTIWRFNTVGDLQIAFADPKHPIWNPKP